jgi:hypothetical protein
MDNYEPALPFIRQAGYLGCQEIGGGVNRDDVDLLKIHNFMVAEGPIHAEAYHWPLSLTTQNLAFEELNGGWLCETTHLVMPNVIQPHKNITPEGLERRFARLKAITGGNLWAATPEDVIDYILCRRHVRLEPIAADEVAVDGSAIPVGVSRHILTFAASGARPEIMADGLPVQPLSVGADRTIFNFDFGRCQSVRTVFRLGSKRR